MDYGFRVGNTPSGKKRDGGTMGSHCSHTQGADSKSKMGVGCKTSKPTFSDPIPPGGFKRLHNLPKFSQLGTKYPNT